LLVVDRLSEIDGSAPGDTDWSLTQGEALAGDLAGERLP
jgi:hypothetical protein